MLSQLEVVKAIYRKLQSQHHMESNISFHCQCFPTFLRDTKTILHMTTTYMIQNIVSLLICLFSSLNFSQYCSLP